MLAKCVFGEVTLEDVLGWRPPSSFVLGLDGAKYFFGREDWRVEESFLVLEGGPRRVTIKVGTKVRVRSRHVEFGETTLTLFDDEGILIEFDDILPRKR